MLFNAPVFLFYFLPATLVVGIVLRQRGPEWAFLLFIALSSLFFYSWTNTSWVLILVASIGGNYLMSRWLLSCRSNVDKKRILILGVMLNLAALGVYKYTGFITSNLNHLGLSIVPHIQLILPIGISFFTFQQVAYLVDSYKGVVVEKSFLRYSFFVSFFPQLIAGPIVHHSEIMAQFKDGIRQRVSFNLAIGLTIFFIGLTKKVLFADSFALYASPVFSAADSAQHVSTSDAWMAVTAYSLQIYFDFSGYSDMAIGIGRMFGLKLPINFDSPYKSVSIIEFWRRWHITLSRFLRDYLYIPLGGNKHGPRQRYKNLMVTMLLGGLWHGAGWGFVLWGALHGVYLMVNHLFNATVGRHRRQNERSQLIHLIHPGFYLTLVLVALAWVPFRSETLSGAIMIWISLFVANDARSVLDVSQSSHFIYAGCVIAIVLPNTQQIMRHIYGYTININYYQPYVKTKDEGKSKESGYGIASGSFGKPLAYVFSLVVAAVSVYGLALNNRISEFIYFQF